MGKNKKSSKKSKSKKSAVAPASHGQQQIDVETVKPEPAASKETTGEPSGSKTLAGGVRKRYHGVTMPKSADGLTAEKLTENQKVIFKKECSTMFGHRHKERTQSLHQATAQLAEQFRQKQLQQAAKYESDLALDRKLDELVKDLPMRSRREVHKRTAQELEERIKRMTSNLGVGKIKPTSSQ